MVAKTFPLTPQHSRRFFSAASAHIFWRFLSKNPSFWTIVVFRIRGAEGRYALVCCGVLCTADNRLFQSSLLKFVSVSGRRGCTDRPCASPTLRLIFSRMVWKNISNYVVFATLKSCSCWKFAWKHHQNFTYSLSTVFLNNKKSLPNSSRPFLKLSWLRAAVLKENFYFDFISMK